MALAGALAVLPAEAQERRPPQARIAADMPRAPSRAAAGLIGIGAAVETRSGWGCTLVVVIDNNTPELVERLTLAVEWVSPGFVGDVDRLDANLVDPNGGLRIARLSRMRACPPRISLRVRRANVCRDQEACVASLMPIWPVWRLNPNPERVPVEIRID